MIYWALGIIALVITGWMAFYYYISRKVRNEVKRERAAVEERIKNAIEIEKGLQNMRNHNEGLLYSLKELTSALVVEHNGIQTIIEKVRLYDGDAEELDKLDDYNNQLRSAAEAFFYRSFKKDVYTWMEERDNNLGNSTRAFSLN